MISYSNPQPQNKIISCNGNVAKLYFSNISKNYSVVDGACTMKYFN